jgi:putative tryptophan/tyrosine transport system substrate-binding protein
LAGRRGCYGFMKPIPFVGAAVKRRQFLIGLGAALAPVGTVRSAFAQGSPVRRIGWLKAGSKEQAPDEIKAFVDALQALGQQHGKSFAIEARFAEGDVRKLRPLADALAQSDVAVIVATSQAAVEAAFAATRSIPIVGRMTMNPMTNGMAKTLGHPEGNVAGLYSLFEELVDRRLELLSEAVPDLHKVGVLVTIDYADSAYWLSQVDASLKRRKLERYVMNVHAEADLDSAFADAAEAGANGLIAIRSPLIVASAERIADLSNSYLYRLPGIFDSREFVDSGCFMSFGPNDATEFRTLAGLVDKILKGAKPGDLAIEQPSTFELVINIKTAQLIGLEVSKAVRANADALIE